MSGLTTCLRIDSKSAIERFQVKIRSDFTQAPIIERIRPPNALFHYQPRCERTGGDVFRQTTKPALKTMNKPLRFGSRLPLARPDHLIRERTDRFVESSDSSGNGRDNARSGPQANDANLFLKTPG